MVPGAPTGMTAANWRAHPYAPWAFRNVAAFLPTAPILGVAPTDFLPGSPLSSLVLPCDDGMPTDLHAMLDATHADGFIVLHRGRIVFEHYAEGMTAATQHLCFSVTKSLVGLIAELLIADGTIGPAAVAGTVVPELAGTGFAPAYLRDLLDMTDGVAFDEDYADSAAQIHDYSRHFWGDGGGGVLAALARLPQRASCCKSFAYRTPVTDVVGLMLERLTGDPLERLLVDLVWGPAGAGPATWVRDTGGRVIASAGLSCTLRDLARVGRLLATAADTPFAEARDAIATGGDRSLFAAGKQPTRPGFSYRSFWWIDHPTGAMNAFGVFGQRLHVVPQDDLVIARFGSHPVASNAATDLGNARVNAAIRTALGTAEI